jgi:hypothetical protein
MFSPASESEGVKRASADIFQGNDISQRGGLCESEF